MKTLSVFLLLIGCALAQLLVVGKQRVPPTTVLFSRRCNGTQSVSPVVCTWNVGPSAGSAVAVIIWNSGTSGTVTTVCDGTGTGGCTGSSTYTIATPYVNGTHFTSTVAYTCNYAGTAASLTVSFSAGSNFYVDAITMTGNTTTGTDCNDASGPSNAQTTTAIRLTAGAITTNNANDLLVFLASNNCGGTAYTAGVDGQGNSMTDSGDTNSGVLEISYRQESATNTYTPTAATGPACGTGGSAQTMAFK